MRDDRLVPGNSLDRTADPCSAMTGSSRVCPRCTCFRSTVQPLWSVLLLSHRLKGCWMPLRGLIYMTGFFGVEYVSGSFLKKYDCCPWDYSNAP